VTANITVLRNAASCNLVRCADVLGHSAASNFNVDSVKITWNHAAEFCSIYGKLLLILWPSMSTFFKQYPCSLKYKIFWVGQKLKYFPQHYFTKRRYFTHKTAFSRKWIRDLAINNLSAKLRLGSYFIVSGQVTCGVPEGRKACRTYEEGCFDVKISDD
jgi:hypothetical protein